MSISNLRQQFVQSLAQGFHAKRSEEIIRVLQIAGVVTMTSDREMTEAEIVMHDPDVVKRCRWDIHADGKRIFYFDNKPMLEFGQLVFAQAIEQNTQTMRVKVTQPFRRLYELDPPNAEESADGSEDNPAPQLHPSPLPT